jgi:hypothetical protein
VEARPGRGTCRGFPGRAPWGQGSCSAAEGAKEEEPESTWGMLQQPTAGVCCLLALVHLGTLPRGSWGLNSLQPRCMLRCDTSAGKRSVPS